MLLIVGLVTMKKKQNNKSMNEQHFLMPEDGYNIFLNTDSPIKIQHSENNPIFLSVLGFFLILSLSGIFYFQFMLFKFQVNVSHKTFKRRLRK